MQFFHYLCREILTIIIMLQVGDKMPSFAAADETGKMVTDKDLIGKKTVIYFYPKDSTPGCTAEACNIRDNYHAFLAQGYQVFGVSKDSQASHIKFKEKYDLISRCLVTLRRRCCKLLGHGVRRKTTAKCLWEHSAKPSFSMRKASLSGLSKRSTLRIIAHRFYKHKCHASSE